MGAPRTAVWLQDAETQQLVPAALWGFEGARRDQILALSLPPDAVEALGQRDNPFVLDNAASAIPELDDGAFAVAPVKLDGGRLCCIVVGIPPGAPHELDEDQIGLLSGLAHQAKLAITNAGSFESLEATFVSTVEALANALEANDEYTSSHTRWITDLALTVGEELGLEGTSLKRLELGALFHDIGKIGIPETILAKPGPLTPEEREIVETHPELGEMIIAPIDRLEEVRPIVRHCHERYDGDGYPDRLSAEDIPIESRIILVCDAYHAMTTDRPYRKRLPVDEAFRRLEEGAGTQFDPDVVKVCVRVLRSEAA